MKHIRYFKCYIYQNLNIAAYGNARKSLGCANTNQKKFPEELASIATSLSLESGKIIGNEKIIVKTLKYFEEAYEIFQKEQNLSFMQKQYNQLLINCDHEVVVLEPKGNYEGIAKGIDESGELLVQKKDGELVKVYAGEVSVRGVYGYV